MWSVKWSSHQRDENYVCVFVCVIWGTEYLYREMTCLLLCLAYGKILHEA